MNINSNLIEEERKINFSIKIATVKSLTFILNFIFCYVKQENTKSLKLKKSKKQSNKDDVIL